MLGYIWISPLHSGPTYIGVGVLCVGSSNPVYPCLLSYGLEGYLVDAVDVRVGVEAPHFAFLCALFASRLRGAVRSVSAGHTVSSLILGEARCGCVR